MRGGLSEAEGSAPRRPGLGETAGLPAGAARWSHPTPWKPPDRSLEKARERGAKSPLEGAGGRALRSARCPGGWSHVCSPGPPEADLNIEFTLPAWLTAVVERADTGETIAKLASFYKNSGIGECCFTQDGTVSLL